MEIEALKKINPVKIEEQILAKKRWNTIAKPLNSLGVIEDIIVRFAGIFGEKQIKEIKPALVVMCGDHGVVAEGVTQTGKEITKIVAENFQKGETCASVMAKTMGVDVFPVDIGMDCDTYPNGVLKENVVTNRKVAKGTKNIAKENAMTTEECLQAIMCGINIVGELKDRGYNIILTGEMGIGNTTPSSALASFFLNLSPRETTGRGAGLSSAGLERKIAAVENTLKRFGKDEGAFNALKAMGGLEIAGMVGLFLGGGVHRVPVVMDGFISTVAALTAFKICPQVLGYIFPSHESPEGCSKKVLEALGFKGVIHGNFCLGEGMGAITLIPIIKMGIEVYLKMSTFEEIKMEAYGEQA